MPVHTSPYRTADASAATWRQRLARAMARRKTSAGAAPSTLQIPVARMPNEAFERMDLDQRVRQLGEW
ncbi:hypothetical protein ACSFA0_00205 [Variovorax sp. LT1P1]|uniref:hypothetical protein n=1 Tax=Variovorax sp. LT1P1 TaxID=3443730 RepID=UPI003F46B917